MKRIAVSLPFEPALLKNQSHITDRGTGKRGKTAAAEKAMWDIYILIRGECNKHGTRFAEADVMLTITAYRPRRNIDAQNVVDSICDAVQTAIGVNDSYFKQITVIAEYDLDDPRIDIVVEQEEQP